MPWTIVDLAAQAARQAISTTIIFTWKISALFLLSFAIVILKVKSTCLGTAWEGSLQHTLPQNIGIYSLASSSSIPGYKTRHIFLLELYSQSWWEVSLSPGATGRSMVELKR